MTEVARGGTMIYSTMHFQKCFFIIYILHRITYVHCRVSLVYIYTCRKRLVENIHASVSTSLFLVERDTSVLILMTFYAY